MSEQRAKRPSHSVVIVGAQWGDEGKGKIVDLFTEAADVVVRYAGGPNAGHTLVVGGQKIVLRLVPSGILHPRSTCLMAQGMVIDPVVLAGEIAALEARGHSVRDRLRLSDRAHVVLSYHRLLDGLREERASADSRIGTTKRGIGPCYEDKAGRRGIRVGDLRARASLEAAVGRALDAWAPSIVALGGEVPTVSSVLAEIEPTLEVLLPLVTDTALATARALDEGKRVLFEGAQGTLLDLDHGTYPFVTSSTAVAAGACVGAGVGPGRIGRVVGITKAYTTRVGAGPFPTELHDEVGARIRERGGEFGSVTGRPRRTGWLDLPALRYAARVNGADALALTKIDVLTGLSEVNVCIAYEGAQGRIDELSPLDIADARPVYQTLPGWTEPLTEARSLSDLPAAARALVDLVAAHTGVPVELVSVGPGREETIALAPPFG